MSHVLHLLITRCNHVIRIQMLCCIHWPLWPTWGDSGWPSTPDVSANWLIICSAWSTSLTLGLQSDMERVQRRAMNIIYPNTPYIEALANAQLTSLKERHVQLCEHFFTQIEQPQHKLQKLLPKPRTTTNNTRCRTRYSLPRVKTNRIKNCFINWCLFNQKNSQWLLTNFRASWYGYV